MARNQAAAVQMQLLGADLDANLDADFDDDSMISSHPAAPVAPACRKAAGPLNTIQWTSGSKFAEVPPGPSFDITDADAQMMSVAREVYRRANYQMIDWNVRQSWFGQEKTGGAPGPVSARILQFSEMGESEVRTVSPAELVDKFAATIAKKQSPAQAEKFRSAFARVQQEAREGKATNKTAKLPPKVAEPEVKKDSTPTLVAKAPPKPLPLPSAPHEGAMFIAAPVNPEANRVAMIGRQLAHSPMAVASPSAAGSGAQDQPGTNDVAKAEGMKIGRPLSRGAAAASATFAPLASRAPQKVQPSNAKAESATLPPATPEALEGSRGMLPESMRLGEDEPSDMFEEGRDMERKTTVGSTGLRLVRIDPKG